VGNNQNPVLIIQSQNKQKRTEIKTPQNQTLIVLIFNLQLLIIFENQKNLKEIKPTTPL